MVHASRPMSEFQKERIRAGWKARAERIANGGPSRVSKKPEQSIRSSKLKFVRIDVPIPQWVRDASLAEKYESKMTELLADAEIEAASHCRRLKNGQ